MGASRRDAFCISHAAGARKAASRLQPVENTIRTERKVTRVQLGELTDSHLLKKKHEVCTGTGFSIPLKVTADDLETKEKPVRQKHAEK